MRRELHPLTERRLFKSFYEDDYLSFGRLAACVVRQERDVRQIFAGHALEDDLRDFLSKGLQTYFEQAKGYVYLISGHAQAGLVKVGKTKADPTLRAKSLYTAAVLSPLFVIKSWPVHDRHWVESEAHRQLTLRGVPRKKEFFLASPDELGHCVEAVRSRDEQRFEPCLRLCPQHQLRPA